MKIAEGMRMGKYRMILLMALASLGGLSTAMHPFYLSVTDVQLFPEEAVIGVTIKVFTDDLEAVLSQRGVPELQLGSPEELPEADIFMARYLDQVIRWNINGQPRTVRYLGKEVEMDVTYLFLETKQIAPLERLEVCHRLFLEELATQENILHLHCEDGLISQRLNRRKDTGVLECK